MITITITAKQRRQITAALREMAERLSEPTCAERQVATDEEVNEAFIDMADLADAIDANELAEE